jgi:hypothetical protein
LGGIELALQPNDRRRSASDEDNVETIGRWVTVRQAADDVGRSVDWVRRQYRSGAVASLTQSGRYGPERLVDIHALREVAATPKVTSSPSSVPAASLPVLAETLHELARQLGEAQERAARAETEAEELRRQLEAAEPTGEGGEDLDAPEDETSPERRVARLRDEPDETVTADHHETLWIAANEHFLRTLPSAAARQQAGDRLLGGRRIDAGQKGRRRGRRQR